MDKRVDFRIYYEDVKIEISSFEVWKISSKNIWNFKILLYYYPNK